MPGEFYIEGKKEKLDISQLVTGLAELEEKLDDTSFRLQVLKSRIDAVENKLDDSAYGLAALKALIDTLEVKGDAIKSQTDRLAGQAPVSGSTVASWQTAESDVVSIGTAGVRNKIHDLTLSIHNLVGTTITVRLYKKVNAVERKCYEQSFNAATDPSGLPIINGTWAIHGVLRVTLQSNDAADNGKALDYDYMLEAMS